MKIWLVGVPMTCGGANSESGDTVLLWRRAGIEVSCLYFTRCDCSKDTARPLESNSWMRKLDAVGVGFVPGESGRLADVPGLRDSIVVSFANHHFLHNWPELAGIGCRCVWAPCMTYTTPTENRAFTQSPPTAVLFQSDYQYGRIEPEYFFWKRKMWAIIHGAFDPLPYLPRVHRDGTFIVGRLARACRTKWSPHLWNILGGARRNGLDIRALCQAWSPDVNSQCGKPPDWARCYPADTLSTREFLARCHAMLGCNWAMAENWPRIGLECMSAGVPLIVDDAGGWREQCGDVAIYCSTPDQYTEAIRTLATRETVRRKMVEMGPARVAKIADPKAISEQWLRLLGALS